MPGGPCRRRCLNGALFFLVLLVLTATLLRRRSRLGSNIISFKAASPAAINAYDKLLIFTIT